MQLFRKYYPSTEFNQTAASERLLGRQRQPRREAWIRQQHRNNDVWTEVRLLL